MGIKSVICGCTLAVVLTGCASSVGKIAEITNDTRSSVSVIRTANNTIRQHVNEPNIILKQLDLSDAAVGHVSDNVDTVVKLLHNVQDKPSFLSNLLTLILYLVGAGATIAAFLFLYFLGKRYGIIRT